MGKLIVLQDIRHQSLLILSGVGCSMNTNANLALQSCLFLLEAAAAAAMGAGREGSLGASQPFAAFIQI